MHINKSMVYLVIIMVALFISTGTRMSCGKKKGVMIVKKKVTKKLTPQQAWCAERQQLINRERVNFPYNHWLRGYTVVIDPGHGIDGDPGTTRTQKVGDTKVTISESNANWDVALRLRRYILGSGGKVLMTVKQKRGEVVCWPQTTIPALTDGELVINPDLRPKGKPRLWSRTRVANLACEKYTDKKVIFVCIHFDYNEKPELWGMTYFTDKRDNETTIAPYLLEATLKEHRQRRYMGEKYHPHVKDKKYYVLNPANNAASNRVLVELGYIGNDGDFWRMKDALVREQYAKTLCQGMMLYAQAQAKADRKKSLKKTKKK